MEIMYIDLFSPRRLGCEGIVAREQIQQDVIIFYFFIHFFFGGGDKRETNGNRLNKKNVEDAEKRSNTVPRAQPLRMQEGVEYFDGNSPQFQYQENGKDRDRCWEVYRFILK